MGTVVLTPPPDVSGPLVMGTVVAIVVLDVSGSLVVETVGAPLTRNRSGDGFRCEAEITTTKSRMTAAATRTVDRIDHRRYRGSLTSIIIDSNRSGGLRVVGASPCSIL